MGDMVMRNIVLTIVTSFVFLACTSTEELYTMSNQKLCMHYLTKPSINIYHSRVGNILFERNEDCSRYVAAAQLVIEKERQTMEYLRKIGESGKPRPLNTQQGTHTYTIDGKLVTCTTTGTHTTCF